MSHAGKFERAFKEAKSNPKKNKERKALINTHLSGPNGLKPLLVELDKLLKGTHSGDGTIKEMRVKMAQLICEYEELLGTITTLEKSTEALLEENGWEEDQDLSKLKTSEEADVMTKLKTINEPADEHGKTLQILGLGRFKVLQAWERAVRQVNLALAET